MIVVLLSYYCFPEMSKICHQSIENQVSSLSLKISQLGKKYIETQRYFPIGKRSEIMHFKYLLYVCNFIPYYRLLLDQIRDIFLLLKRQK